MRRSSEEISKLYEKCLDGECFICETCDGTGILPDCETLICDTCWGDGILDWIEKIMGKPCPWNVSGQSMSSSSSSGVSSSYQTPNGVPTQKAVKKYIESKTRRKHEHENFIRSRTVQRFHQMSAKLKGCMQRRRYTERNNQTKN